MSTLSAVPGSNGGAPPPATHARRVAEVSARRAEDYLRRDQESPDPQKSVGEAAPVWERLCALSEATEPGLDLDAVPGAVCRVARLGP
mmetsp:Transcript_3093/g.9411  ORF Transcript_3093/g.9411 Transcript_3093/m.9411 type:complete len:88 (+) Transcript_3093:223-486(+)|eukprot:scaffold50695_cov24-Tisochrysis_lutea.AAC.1